MPSASPSATTTIMTSSSSEPEAERLRLLHATRARRRRPPASGASASSAAAALVAGSAPRLAASARLGLGERLLVDRVARHLVVGGRGGRGLLRRGIVQQTRLDDLLRARCSGARARGRACRRGRAGSRAWPGGRRRARRPRSLDLRRVHGERALDADAEGLLADGEGLAHALALALDDDALEDLGAAARALDHLEVDADAVAGLEGGTRRSCARSRLSMTVLMAKEKLREPEGCRSGGLW